ncbi:exodeoxyribonuclease I [uncultured Azohydromonas sp.]|jgi:Exonuclease I|uniref:exodeoxyribonuclease I n=1 Tax=uncultured Azohydromonas sp. TaxID=487342 RepID=UPI0026357BF1|nr:exodeoxyribonuclease I [uncultured Azohydromonas sp.]
MSDMTFFWHDYETFGRVPRRDRPAQFAGVRTDAELNEIGEPLSLYCHPPLDMLPDPESCLLTGILPQHCQEHGVAEHAFAAAIEAELSQPGTVGVGYNSIRFDDEVTRHLFWRNLIDPYAREWQNGCGRWDLLDVVRCAYALRPEGMEWPRHPDGRVSFKLEDLTAANGLAHEAAHDALSDVRATIALARRLRQAQPKLWDFCLKLRRKDAVLAEIGVDKPFLHVSGMFGAERGCLALMWPLGPHPSNRNELLCWDLAADPQELFDLDAQAIRERLFTRAQDLPEGVTRLPIKSVHINKSPVVIGNLKTLSDAQAERWGLDKAQQWARAEVFKQRQPLPPQLWAQVFERPAAAGPVDVDEDLYGGFVGNADRHKLNALRAAPPHELALREPPFEDPRLSELVFRWRARNFSHTLDEGERARWDKHRARRLHEGQGGVLTLAAYAERIDTLSETADERGQEILGALYDWAEEIAP